MNFTKIRQQQQKKLSVRVCDVKQDWQINTNTNKIRFDCDAKQHIFELYNNYKLFPCFVLMCNQIGLLFGLILYILNTRSIHTKRPNIMCVV